MRFLLLLCLIVCFSCKENPKTAVPKLIKQLNSTIAAERSNAALTLGRYGEQAKEAVPALIICLEDPNSGVKSAAAYALRVIDTPQAQNALQKYEK